MKNIRYYVGAIFLFSLLSAAFIGCNPGIERRDYSDPAFRVDITVELDMIAVDPIMPNFIIDMEYYQGKLVMMYWLDNEFIHLFDAETGEKLGSALPEGRGTGEMIFPSCIRLNRLDGTFTTFDKSTRQLYSGQIDSLFKGVPISRINEDFSTASRVYYLSQGYFKFLPPIHSAPERRYVMVKWDGEEVKYEGYPHDDFRLMHASFAPHNIGFSKDETKMVAAGTYGMILEIFNIEKGINNTHTRYFWQTFENIETGRPDSEKSGIGIVDFYCTDKYIYAIVGEPNTDKRYENIVIFDWKGNPLKILRTNHYRLNRICLDDEEHYLYVVGERIDGIQFIGRLDLTKIL